MSDEQQPKSKIIVDDDWKERVQAEKETAEQEEKQPDEAAAELPPASFATLVHSLTAQALASMGQVPDADGKPTVRLDFAKHLIDSLAVLEEKTAGNTTPEESQLLAQVLHELRMLFVAIGKNPPPSKPDDDEKPKPQIVT